MPNVRLITIIKVLLTTKRIYANTTNTLTENSAVKTRRMNKRNIKNNKNKENNRATYNPKSPFHKKII